MAVLVDTDTAAVAMSVAASTIRDWHRRGLVHRYGTARRALWDLGELYRVRQRRREDR